MRTGLGKRQSAQTVIAAKFHDHDGGMQLQEIGQCSDGILGGGAAGALIDDFVVVAFGVEFLLQMGKNGLTGRRP